MAQATGISKLAGNAGHLMGAVGILAFFIGIFGAPRMWMFVGVALIVLSLIAYFVEEFSPRR